MHLNISQQMKMGQQMKLAPRMIQSMEILQLPLQALEERIEEELGENVCLERETENENVPDAEMDQMREQAPAIVQAMLDERDAYMAAGLDILTDKNVITAVMGIAHVDGVERSLQAKGWKLVNPICPRT